METFELISNIINPPVPNSPHFPLRQYSVKPRNTTATIAVVKNVLHRRALRHLKTKKEKNLNEDDDEKASNNISINFLMHKHMQLNFGLFTNNITKKLLLQGQREHHQQVLGKQLLLLLQIHRL